MMDKFSDWLTNRYRSWSAALGGKQSVMNFARFLGVKQPSLTRWMNGDNPPDFGNAIKLAEKLGPEIWDYLDYGKPNPLLQEMDNHLTELEQRYLALEDNESREKFWRIVRDAIRKMDE